MSIRLLLGLNRLGSWRDMSCASTERMSQCERNVGVAMIFIDKYKKKENEIAVKQQHRALDIVLKHINVRLSPLRPQDVAPLTGLPVSQL